MSRAIARVIRWLLDTETAGTRGHLVPRWLWLRALGLIFFSAFYSLTFQVRGLIGLDGILPARDYLRAVASSLGVERYWYAPTLLWLGSGALALQLLVAAGLIASFLLVLNLWPRASIGVCLVCFLSFVAAAQDFSSYQSDGMLLSAGFLSLFFAPPGLRPGLGSAHPPSRASRLMLLWLWFTIYFESGVVKLLSHDPQWRSLTAMDEYYQNGPLPNWIGWYAQQLPHHFQTTVTLATLVIELGVVWLVFLPGRCRIVCFCIVTPFQLGIILTANLAFLNHFVLALGVLLLDDRLFLRLSPRTCSTLSFREEKAGASGSEPASRRTMPCRAVLTRASPLLMLFLIFYNTAALLLMTLVPALTLPTSPIAVLEPFRISNEYGLFAVMTRARYEIEFQGSRDGSTWVAYPFRYKPQDVRQAPRFYAPYQPRLDWNLWFASLGTWCEYPWVLRTEVLLLKNDPAVVSLFAGNPFAGEPPRQVRAVEWQYWFTDLATRRRNGTWWRRDFRGLYAPAVELGSDGKPVVVAMP